MIKIKKGNDECVVTKGVYDNLYHDLGYKIVEDKKEPKLKDASVISEKNEKAKTGEEKAPVEPIVNNKHEEPKEDKKVKDKK